MGAGLAAKGNATRVPRTTAAGFPEAGDGP